MLDHPQALSALSDAGAHVGTVCDASFTTFMLTHWVRDRAKDTLPLQRAVEMMTRRNARYLPDVALPSGLAVTSDFDAAVVSLGNNLIANTAGSSGWVASDLQNVNPLLNPL